MGSGEWREGNWEFGSGNVSDTLGCFSNFKSVSKRLTRLSTQCQAEPVEAMSENENNYWKKKVGVGYGKSGERGGIGN